MSGIIVIMICGRKQKFWAVVATMWADIGFHGGTNTKFIQSKLNSKKYLELIWAQIATHTTRISGE